MPHKIYLLLQATFAELNQQPIPVDDEFDTFNDDGDLNMAVY
ncbi:MAG: hypothetical protein GAK29_00502 [Acinetobacter bereziniae]|uniref:Uncharacterized protein n=1 Tax=Acinetobacter bereziniae TaxID=106648 RepID=A0A833PK61_ACIBZ|nr:MAG: hypothetical protein GAK29_00502 [Acinetobacter bereziniae]